MRQCRSVSLSLSLSLSLAVSLSISLSLRDHCTREWTEPGTPDRSLPSIRRMPTRRLTPTAWLSRLRKLTPHLPLPPLSSPPMPPPPPRPRCPRNSRNSRVVSTGTFGSRCCRCRQRVRTVLTRSLGQVLLPTHQGLRPCRVREPALRQQSRYVATRSPYGVLLFRIDLTRDTRQSSCPSSPTTPPASACASQ